MKKKGISQSSNVFSKIRSPESVKILIFVNQQVSLKDYWFISQCRNLVRLDLSHNNISSFPSKFSFEAMPNLRVLLLHYNQLLRFSDLRVLLQAHSLEYLTLFSNPLIVSNSKARHFILNQLPRLKLLDEHIVLQQERSSAVLPRSELAPCSEQTRVPYPLVDLTEVTTTRQYMLLIRVEQDRYVREWLRCNPVVRLQRWVRRVVLGRRKGLGIAKQGIKRQRKEKHQKEEKLVEGGTVEETVLAVGVANKNGSQQPVQGEVHTAKIAKVRSPQMRIESLLRCNYDFWTTTVRNLGFSESKWVIISHSAFKFIKGNKPEILQRFTSQKCKSYKFIRIDRPQVKDKTLLGYLTRGCMQSVVLKPPRKVPKLRIIKFKPVKYKVKELSKLTQQDIEKININCSRLQKLEESYYENGVELKGTIGDLVDFLKYYLRVRATNGSFKYSIYCPKILERVASAVKIQSLWRGYKVRKEHKTIQSITKNRAANRIQKWMRNMPFHQRLKFLKYIKDDLVDQPLYRLVLHQKLYLLLHNLTSHRKSFLHLPLQQSQILTHNHSICLLNPQNPRSLLPSYFPHPPPQSTALAFPPSPSHPGTLYSILHASAKKVFTSSHNNTRFVVFEYSSQAVLRQRKLFLALKTYSFRYHAYFQCVSAFKKERMDEYEGRVGRAYGVLLRREEFVRKGKVFEVERNGVFLGEPGEVGDGSGLIGRNYTLKFIAGSKIYEAVCQISWKKEEERESKEPREPSKFFLRKSNQQSQHISKAVSVPTSMLPSPRDLRSNLNLLSSSLAQQTLSNSIPSSSVLAHYLTANPSSSTVSPQTLPTKSYGRYASIQQTLTTQQHPQQPTLQRDASHSEISKSQSIELEIERIQNKRLKIMRSKQEKLYLKSVRLTNRQEELRSLRVEEEREKVTIATEIERKKLEQDRILASKHQRVFDRVHRSQDRDQQREFETHFVTKGNYAIKNELIQKIRNSNANLQIKSPRVMKKKYANAAQAGNTIHLLKQRLKQHLPIKTKQSERQTRPAAQPEIPQQRSPNPQQQRQHSISLKNKPKRDRRQIIHSVFPQQFYPLHQQGEDNQDRFCLPRIGRS